MDDDELGCWDRHHSIIPFEPPSSIIDRRKCFDRLDASWRGRVEAGGTGNEKVSGFEPLSSGPAIF